MWFMYHQGRVTGPWRDEELTAKPEFREGALIWGHPLSEWVDGERWQQQRQIQEEQTQATRIRLLRTWKVLSPEGELGPWSYHEMMDYLRSQKDVKNIMLWTEGYKEWQPIFAIHKVMDELGLGRRAHPRVPISGKVELKRAGDKKNYRLISISEGGFGAAEVADLHVGEEAEFVLISDSLARPVVSKAEMVYLDHEHLSAGFKFLSLSNEMKSIIVEYVRDYLAKHSG
jgi:hypothetical protein